MLKQITAIVLSLMLVQVNVPAAPVNPTTPWNLSELVNKPYLDLLELAHDARFSSREIDEFKEQLDRGKDAEKKRLQVTEQQLKKQIEQAREQLERLNKMASRDSEEMAARRQDLHCNIQKLERQLAKTQTERTHGLPVSHDNKLAKLELIQHWPARKREIEQTISSERARERRFGNVEDIGVRNLGEDTEKDIKLGEEAVREMKASGYMPPELEDREINAYVRQLAEKISANSDLKVPLKVTVLDSEEVNAFALPGGFLFLNTGLVQKAETESELAGVMAHEIAHIAAHHGQRLMRRASIANLIYQAAQVAALVLTGGVAGIGTYYALEYGFMGLGMALNLTLLGVSRDFESEADQLGVQYAWKAGYAPMGFITFFDKMASEKGYVKSASFFRTHPAFFERIVSTFTEIEYLPPKNNARVDSTEFHKVKERLAQLERETTPDRKRRPTLGRGPECPEEVRQEIPTITQLKLATGCIGSF